MNSYIPYRSLKNSDQITFLYLKSLWGSTNSGNSLCVMWIYGVYGTQGLLCLLFLENLVELSIYYGPRGLFEADLFIFALCLRCIMQPVWRCLYEPQ